MSSLKFTLSDVTSFLPDILCGLKKIYIPAWSDILKNFTATEIASTWSILFFTGELSRLRVNG